MCMCVHALESSRKKWSSTNSPSLASRVSVQEGETPDEVSIKEIVCATACECIGHLRSDQSTNSQGLPKGRKKKKSLFRHSANVQNGVFSSVCTFAQWQQRILQRHEHVPAQWNTTWAACACTCGCLVLICVRSIPTFSHDYGSNVSALSRVDCGANTFQRNWKWQCAKQRVHVRCGLLGTCSLCARYSSLRSWLWQQRQHAQQGRLRHEHARAQWNPKVFSATCACTVWVAWCMLITNLYALSSYLRSWLWQQHQHAQRGQLRREHDRALWNPKVFSAAWSPCSAPVWAYDKSPSRKEN